MHEWWVTNLSADVDLRALVLVAAGEAPTKRDGLKIVSLRSPDEASIVKWRGRYLQLYVLPRRRLVGPFIPAKVGAPCPLAWSRRFRTAESLVEATLSLQKGLI